MQEVFYCVGNANFLHNKKRKLQVIGGNFKWYIILLGHRN